MYRECLSKREAILGSNHPETLQSIHNLAIMYENRGKYEKAEMLFKKCLSKREAVLGPHHADTVETRKCLDSLLK